MTSKRCFFTGHREAAERIYPALRWVHKVIMVKNDAVYACNRHFTFNGRSSIAVDDVVINEPEYYVCVVLGLDSTEEDAKKAILEYFAAWKQEH